MDNLLQEFDNYIANELGKSQNTRLSYVRDLRLMMSWMKEQGFPEIQDIGITEIQAYIDHLTEEHRTNATISRCVASIRQFFIFAKARGYVYTDPSVDLKAPKVIRKAPKIVEETDIEKLLGAPDITTNKGIRDRAMLELMLSTGMRVSELLGLKKDDIDFKKRTIQVTGSGGKTRTVTYRKGIARYLQDYFLISRGQLIAGKGEKEDFFVSCQGEKMTRQGFWKLLKSYGKSVGIKDEITPYTLRHSFAVSALKNGEDIKTVQNTLGHSAIYSTNEYTSLI